MGEKKDISPPRKKETQRESVASGGSERDGWVKGDGVIDDLQLRETARIRLIAHEGDVSLNPRHNLLPTRHHIRGWNM